MKNSIVRDIVSAVHLDPELTAQKINEQERVSIALNAVISVCPPWRRAVRNHTSSHSECDTAQLGWLAKQYLFPEGRNVPLNANYFIQPTTCVWICYTGEKYLSRGYGGDY